MAHDGKIRFGMFSPLSGLTFDALMARAGFARVGSDTIPSGSTTTCGRAVSPSSTIWISSRRWPRVAAPTERLRLGTLVICNAYRNPAMLAKSLCAIDQISKGRLDVGLGIGWMKEEFTAYGFEYLWSRWRVKQSEDRRFGRDVHRAQGHVQGALLQRNRRVQQSQAGQKPHPPITIGGAGKKVMLRIVAKYADRWNIPGGYPDIADLTATLKGHCAAAGRDFNEIEVSEQLLVCMGASAEEVERKWQVASKMRPFATTAIKGTPPELIAALKDRIAKGVRTFIIFFSDGSAPQTIEMFAKEVMPAFA